jgi:adenylate cyclase
MSNEYEKRFLVNESAFPAGAKQDGVRHTRGYLSFDPPIRVRAFASDVDGRKGYTTAENDEPPFRLGERERRVEHYAAQELLTKAEGAVLEFTRYRAKVGSHLWNVDIYEGALEGLWLASLERESATEAFDKPVWVTTDVTNDPRYTEETLARVGRKPE